jgi:hypothetical protein
MGRSLDGQSNEKWKVEIMEKIMWGTYLTDEWDTEL